MKLWQTFLFPWSGTLLHRRGAARNDQALLSPIPSERRGQPCGLKMRCCLHIERAAGIRGRADLRTGFERQLERERHAVSQSAARQTVANELGQVDKAGAGSRWCEGPQNSPAGAWPTRAGEGHVQPKEKYGSSSSRNGAQALHDAVCGRGPATEL